MNAADPLEIAAAENLAFELHRDAGDKDAAARSLDHALHATLEARRKRGADATYRVKAERALGRVLAAYGENAAAGRAFDRALEAVDGDHALAGATMLQAMGFCFVTGDVDRARLTLLRGRDTGAPEDDLVRAALWLGLLEKPAAEKPTGGASDGSASNVLEGATHTSSFAGSLASWGIGRLGDVELASAAKTPEEKAQASFYLAMRGPESARKARLDDVVKSAVLDVVEVDLARELTAPRSVASLPRGIALP